MLKVRVPCFSMLPQRELLYKAFKVSGTLGCLHELTFYKRECIVLNAWLSSISVTRSYDLNRFFCVPRLCSLVGLIVKWEEKRSPMKSSHKGPHGHITTREPKLCDAGGSVNNTSGTLGHL